MHDEFVIAIDLSTGHGKEGVSAPHKAGHGAQGHQRVHVGSAVEQALEAADEELLVDDHDDAGQQQLDEAELQIPIIVFTTCRESSLHADAAVAVVINADAKFKEDTEKKSVQPMGSLFEEALFISLEALVIQLMEKRGISEKELKKDMRILNEKVRKMCKTSVELSRI